MSRQRVFSRRGFIAFGATAAAGTVLLAACQPPQTVEKVVEKQVEVTKVVEKQVEKAVEVTKVVEKSVEKQVVITATAKPKERVEVQFQTDWLEGGSRAKIITEALAIWAKANPKKIVIPINAYGQPDKQIAADTMPDLGNFGFPYWVKYYYPMGIWQDITPNIKARNYDTADFVKANESYHTWEGKWLGIPLEVHLVDWGINQTFMENAGVALPDSQKWTWDDLTDLGKKVTKADKNLWGTSNPSAWWVPYSAIWAYGGDLISADGKKTVMGDGPAMDAWTLVTNWIHTLKIAPTRKVTTDNKLGWAAGSYAFNMRVMPRQKVDFKYQIVLPPLRASTGKRVSCIDGKSYLVSSTAKKRDTVEETADVAMFVGGKELQELNLQYSGCEPNRESIINSDAFAPKAVRDVFLESNKVRRGPPYEGTVYYRAWERTIWPIMYKIFDGEISIKEGMAQITEQGDKQLRGEGGTGVV